MACQCGWGKFLLGDGGRGLCSADQPQGLDEAAPLKFRQNLLDQKVRCLKSASEPHFRRFWCLVG